MLHNYFWHGPQTPVDIVGCLLRNNFNQSTPARFVASPDLPNLSATPRAVATIYAFRRTSSLVVIRRQAPAQTKESARRDKRPSPGYCVAICFYCVGLGHMFLLCGARPYVSIGWLWAWGSALCFYYVALGYMFLLCGARRYVSIGWLWAWGSAICFYYVALGYMFLLVGCGRGARLYVSIGWLWAWR